MQLALQAADLFREPKGFGVRGGQIAGDSLNLTLRKDGVGKKVNLSQQIQEDLFTAELDPVKFKT